MTLFFFFFDVYGSDISNDEIVVFLCVSLRLL